MPTVMTSAHPTMLYDYGGFRPRPTRSPGPAPGHPELAARVRGLLDDAGIKSGESSERGFDHGTFVPLKVTYPDANVPTIQLSCKRGSTLPITWPSAGRWLRCVTKESSSSAAA